METIIRTENLCRRFGQRWAYARIDMQVKKGERVLLIGANGSGKTTLIRSLATLLPPSLGKLELFGQPANQQLHRLRSRIGLISHHVGLYEDLSAVENLRLFARLMEKPMTVGQAEKLVSGVGLEIRPDPIRGFSAGMRKRVSIAALQLKDPELILLDEPFSALDPQGMDELSQLIQNMSATLILASHQVERAAALCHRAILLENATIRWQGEAERAWKAWRISQQVEG